MPGSNRRPSACKADVITNYTNRTKKVEMAGIDPAASRMQSERSTI